MINVSSHDTRNKYTREKKNDYFWDEDHITWN